MLPGTLAERLGWEGGAEWTFSPGLKLGGWPRWPRGLEAVWFAGLRRSSYRNNEQSDTESMNHVRSSSSLRGTA